MEGSQKYNTNQKQPGQTANINYDSIFQSSKTSKLSYVDNNENNDYLWNGSAGQ